MCASFFITNIYSQVSKHSNKVSAINSDNIATTYDAIPQSKIMILASYHFRQEHHYDELSNENQKEVLSLIEKLQTFQPTKVVIEKPAKLDSIYNSFYKKYLLDDKAIDTLSSEAFQLGFRLAKQMNHQQIYLFDDHTEFIGSLENFTWDKFNTLKKKDSVFVEKYRDIIRSSFKVNESYLNTLSLYDNILQRNSPQSQRRNAQRMHIYEVRLGIQDSWIGPDWLGRSYQRNIRMMANVMKFNNPGKDRILVIVGDNHKWILDTLFEFNPEFEVISSYDVLKN